MPVHSLYGAQAPENMVKLTHAKLASAAELGGLVTDAQEKLMTERGAMDEITKSLTDPTAAEKHFWEVFASPASGGQPFNLYVSRLTRVLGLLGTVRVEKKCSC